MSKYTPKEKIDFRGVCVRLNSIVVEANFTMMSSVDVYFGDSLDVLKQFPDGHFDLIMTSPPYADARKGRYFSIPPKDYPDWFINFGHEFYRVLSDKGSFVLNIREGVVKGLRDRYVWRTIDKLSSIGWRCVDDYIWVKSNSVPGFWSNRLRNAWEYCFHMTKKKHFSMYAKNVMLPIGNWSQKLKNTKKGTLACDFNKTDSGFKVDGNAWVGKKFVNHDNVIRQPTVCKNFMHPAVYPKSIPDFFIKLFTKENDIVLDPFAGSGTTALAAMSLNRNAVLIEKEIKYLDAIKNRLGDTSAITSKLLNITYH